MNTAKLLEFYSTLGRPITVMEAARLGGLPPATALEELETLVAQKKARAEEGFYSTTGLDISARKRQDLLLDVKWRRLERLAKYFRFVPFIDFVFASGSIAMGNVTLRSDFDVLIGVRPGRIFTVRYLLNFVFGSIGKRRMDDQEGSSPDKLCFNHFVTESTAVKPPWNAYRKELYANLVPIYGQPEAIGKLFPKNTANLHLDVKGTNLIGGISGFLLKGNFGDLVENKILAPVAKRRLAAYIARKSQKGRVVVSDSELEFHFDLRYEEKFAGLEL